METVIYYNFSYFIDHRYISDPSSYWICMRHPYEIRLAKLEKRVAKLESILESQTKKKIFA